MPHECRPRCLQRTRTTHDAPCLPAPAHPRRLARPAAGSVPPPSHAPRPLLPVCAQPRPRDDPG
eukprot:1603735-Prymnesium_polylepis.1